MKKYFLLTLLMIGLPFFMVSQIEGLYPTGGSDINSITKLKTYVVQTGNKVFDDALKSAMEKSWTYQKPEYITEDDFKKKQTKKEVMVYVKIDYTEYANLHFKNFVVSAHTHDKVEPNPQFYYFPFDYTQASDGSEAGSDKSLPYFATKVDLIIKEFCFYAAKYIELGPQKFLVYRKDKDASKLNSKTLLIDQELFANGEVTEETFKKFYTGKYEVNAASKNEELCKSADKNKYARFFVMSFLDNWNITAIDPEDGQILFLDFGFFNSHSKRLNDKEFGNTIDKKMSKAMAKK